MSDAIGDIARQMAAAGASKPKADTGGKPKGGVLSKVFCLQGFKLPSKSDTYKNDDGTSTRRLAYALVKLADTEMHFNASVYEVTEKTGETEVYCGMPSSGKRFPRPVFVTDDASTQQQYDAWRVEVATSYLAWEAALAKSGSAPVATVGQQTIRIVRKAPVAQPVA
jgi:hypothetical protein